MSEKKQQEEQNPSEEVVIADDELDVVAGGITEGGCFTPLPLEPGTLINR
jgi:hypothetical protein